MAGGGAALQLLATQLAALGQQHSNNALHRFFFFFFFTRQLQERKRERQKEKGRGSF